MKWAAGETWKGVQWCMASAPCKAAAKKYGTMALEDGMKSAAALQNLYGSSHSYLQNLNILSWAEGEYGELTHHGGSSKHGSPSKQGGGGGTTYEGCQHDCISFILI